MVNNKTRLRLKRKARIRGKISGTATRPRLSVYRSHRYLYGQLIDDVASKTLSAVMSGKGRAAELSNNISDAEKLGTLWGNELKAKGITHIVFDCNGFKYHGIIAAFADGLRKAGVIF